MFKFVFILLVLLMALPALGMEALMARYTCTDCVTYTVVVRDTATARINMEVMGEPYHVYALMRNNDYWLVTTDEHGKNYVSNYSETKRELQQSGRRVEQGLVFMASQTAAQKNVGGFMADVFSFQDKQSTRAYEFALSETPDVYAVSVVLLPFVADFGHMPEFDMVTAFNHNTSKRYGLVSLNSRFWLESLARGDYDDAYFALPPDAAVVSLDEN